MNDKTHDELLSAVLDGDATEAEIAQVQGDPALATRLDELASVRARLQTEPVPAAPAGAVDTAIAAALDAASSDDPASSDGPTSSDDTAPGDVAPVITHRRWQRAAPVLAAAAALIVVVLGLVALTRSPSNNKTMSTAAGTIGGASATSTADSAITEQAGGESAPTEDSVTARLAATESLGSFTDRQALVDAAKSPDLAKAAAQDAMTPQSTTVPGVPGPGSACAPPRGVDSLASTRTAELDGEPVLAFVYDAPTAPVVVVVDANTSAPLFTDGP